MLTGALLLNKRRRRSVHDATRRLAAQTDHRWIPPHPVFSSVGREALRALCAAFTPIWVAAGMTVIEQGAARSEAYFDARGELEARRRRERGDHPRPAHERRHVRRDGAALSGPAHRERRSRAALHRARGEARRDDDIAQREPEVGLELAAYCRDRMVENLVRMSDVLRAQPEAKQARAREAVPHAHGREERAAARPG